jgi:hypothetical protein
MFVPGRLRRGIDQTRGVANMLRRKVRISVIQGASRMRVGDLVRSERYTAIWSVEARLTGAD